MKESASESIAEEISIITDSSVESSDFPSSDAESLPDSEIPEESPESDMETSVTESSEESLSSEVSSVTESSQESSSDSVMDMTPHKVNGFLVVGNRAMEPFGGSEVSGGYTAEKLNAFKQAVGDSVSVYIMAIPNSCAFYYPEGYEKYYTNTASCLYGIRDNLIDVGFVDTLAALENHTDEEIYARTDHHWFALGAYYAAEEFSKVAGTSFATLDQFTSYSIEGFLGSTYSAYDVTELKKYPEVFTWYEPNQSCTVNYCDPSDFQFKFEGSLFSSSKTYTKFIYGDSYAVQVKTGLSTGRKLLLIKDSYGNALVPFLISGFDEVYVIDMRKYEKNVKDLIEENGITDVLFGLSSFSVAGSKRNYITSLINQ